MGVWFWVVGLAVLSLAAMALAFRLPRGGVMAVGSALLAGLAAYGLQGQPFQPGSPRMAEDSANGEGPLLVEARQRMFDNAANPRHYMILADGFARQGQFENAATILADATRRYPHDAEAWTALGNVLVAHAEGQLAAPAKAAYASAAKADPSSVAPGFFLGIAYLRQGKLIEAHKAWSGALQDTPENAYGRAEVAGRLTQLETILRKLAEQP